MSPIIATHSGVFHADDVFACAVLSKLHPSATIVRTRGEAILSHANFKVDVGGQYRPELGEYDHHQKGRAGSRTNGVFYSSFGLVWKDYGAAYCDGDVQLATAVDEEFVQAIDAIDNGQEVNRPGIPGVRVMSVSGLMSLMNPCWHEAGKNFDLGFHAAMALAEVFLQRVVENVRGRLLAEAYVRGQLESQRKNEVLILDRFVPWGEYVRDFGPEHMKLVMFPSEEGTWMVQAINKTRGTFDVRMNLPETWAGLRAEELTNLTGVEDAVFCHPGRFICGARTKAGAAKLAELALLAARPAPEESAFWVDAATGLACCIVKHPSGLWDGYIEDRIGMYHDGTKPTLPVLPRIPAVSGTYVATGVVRTDQLMGTAGQLFEKQAPHVKRLAFFMKLAPPYELGTEDNPGGPNRPVPYATLPAALEAMRYLAQAMDKYHKNHGPVDPNKQSVKLGA